MEETLGKRILSHRKRLGLTQDQLAEKMGITAQAVSKWENDQSCPDITMLPKLAAIFGITTDQLLGIVPEEKVHEGEVIGAHEDDDREPDGIHIQNGHLDFHWDGGRRNGIGLAILVLLVGGLLLAGNLLKWDVSFWGLLWPSALLIFGLMGLLPRFSFFRLGCALFGGYFLAHEIGILPTSLSSGLIFPVVLVLLGLSLLAEALRRPRKHRFHVGHSGGDNHKFSSSCTTGDESFECDTAFGSNHYIIDLPRLSDGDIDCSFGELTVDLSGCEEVSENCHVDVDCSFGEVTVLVPRRFRAETENSTAFASVTTEGFPAQDNRGIIHLDCDVSFGEIKIRYI
ncbi:MAG: helix-turn-helix transcriptional regulator [Oscillospiraceae bacterium]|nr:helix-turn-helix transcriptional regulator [Oscillospiraceae bacterium]